MAKRTFDMATPSPDPVQVTNDTEEIPLQDQLQTAVYFQDWTGLANVLRNGENSELREILQNKAYVRWLLGYVLQNGRLDIVFLLEKVHKLDMTQFLKTDGKACTILCDAVKGRHLGCVDYLLQMGAKVNQQCENHYPPLTQACEGGNKDLVKKLLLHGACVNGSVQSRCTPLIMAVHFERIDIVRCLLENGANPNVQTEDGDTALHEAVFWAENAGVTLAKLLLQYKAELLADKFGNTPLSLVAKYGPVDILDFFLEVLPMSRLERVNALELFAAYRAPEDMATVVEFLQRAMEERYQDPFNVLHKPDQVPDPDLGYVLESRSPQELSERKHNSTVLLIECLAIRKRNENNKERGVDRFWDPMIYRCLLIEGQLKEACFILGNDSCTVFNQIYHELCSTLELFRRELDGGNMSLFPAVIMYLNVCKRHLRNRPWEKDDSDYSRRTIYRLLDTTLEYLLLCIRAMDAGNNNDVQVLKETTKDINASLQRDYHPFNTYSLLLVAVRNWKLWWFDLDNTLSEYLIVLLIKCGASIDHRDQDGDTSLHILAKSEDAAACSMARLLLKNSAHLDLLDSQGRTPAQCAGNEDMKTLLTSIVRPLQCLAVHVILKHRLSLEDLPEPLKRFVAEHTGSHM